MMGMPTYPDVKSTESKFSKHLHPFIVLALNFTYVYAIIFGVQLPPMFETILMSVNLASFGRQALKNVKKI